jgi:hypothetical protein
MFNDDKDDIIYDIINMYNIKIVVNSSGTEVGE